MSCGKDDHGEDCPGPLKCYHCRGPHPASSKDCDRYRFEHEILQIRNKERVSFAEAKRIAHGIFSSQGKTFASLFRSGPKPGDASSVSRSETLHPPGADALKKVTSQKATSAESSQQKRTRSEDSLEGILPAKVQSPALNGGCPETPRVSASTEAAPSPVTPHPSGSAKPGDECGATVPSAAVQSPSSSATASEWREVFKGRPKKSGDKGRVPVTAPRCVSSHVRHPQIKGGKGQPSLKGSPTKQS